LRHTGFHERSKAGVSTLLGMLICVSILFSVVIPLFLYINMMNNLYNQTFLEMTELDQQRMMESITVFAYPTAGHVISVYIRNKCVLNVNITRIWVTDLQNKTVHLLDESLYLTPGSYSITPINASSLKLGASVNVDVATERGKVYASETNTLYLTAKGEWEVLPYAIDIVIEGTGEGRKRYAVKAEQLDGEFGSSTGWSSAVSISTIGRIAQASVGVPGYGYYNLTVYREGQSDPFFWKVVKVPLFAPLVVPDTGN